MAEGILIVLRSSRGTNINKIGAEITLQAVVMRRVSSHGAN